MTATTWWTSGRSVPGDTRCSGASFVRLAHTLSVSFCGHRLAPLPVPNSSSKRVNRPNIASPRIGSACLPPPRTGTIRLGLVIGQWLERWISPRRDLRRGPGEMRRWIHKGRHRRRPRVGSSSGCDAETTFDGRHRFVDAVDQAVQFIRGDGQRRGEGKNKGRHSQPDASCLQFRCQHRIDS